MTSGYRFNGRPGLARARIAALRVGRGLVLAASAAALAGCNGPQPVAAAAPHPPGSLDLSGAGSTFSSVLFDRWFSAYHDAHPTTFVKYDSVGSGEGVRRFIGQGLQDNEAVDFGASDSAMSDAQLAQTNNDALMIPITAGCVVLAYNLPSVHGDIQLSRKAYTGMFLGEVTKWNDPQLARTNPGITLPDLPIGVIVRQDSSGTTFALTSHLAAADERWRSRFPPSTMIQWPADPIRGRGNEGVAGLVHNFPGSIGYVGYEFAHRLGLAVAALENRDGHFVRPSGQSCAAGLATADLPANLRAFVPDPSGAESYPIVTFSWVLLHRSYSNPQTATGLRDLVRWCLTDGQQYASELGYVPLPASVVAKALQALPAAAK